MSVLITGSIAYDAVFSFAGAFGEQITRPVEPVSYTHLTLPTNSLV